MDKSIIVNTLLEKGILVSPEFLNEDNGELDASSFGVDIVATEKQIEKDIPSDIEIGKNNGAADIVGVEDEVLSVSTNDRILDGRDTTNVKIVFSYNREAKKGDVGDFVLTFKKRYELLKNILVSRQELQNTISIARVNRRQLGEKVSIIGIVTDKAETKNGNLRIVLEDTTGICNVLITKNNPELYKLARDIVLDEVIGINCTASDKILFCNGLYFPDIPITHELKKSPNEVYAAFISDIHFGIKNFLSKDFMKFIKWLRGEYGNEKQKEIASKIGYLFVTGDVVEGIGIYPGQEEDLDIKDIKLQYEEAARHFKMIPGRIKIIICGGNHDAIRISEPQPAFDKVISKGLYEIPNMTIVSNPALVNIASSEDFPGFNVLMYHGFSFPYYADNVPSITEGGGIFRCDLIMKFLLQKRHLAPTHSSNMYIPDEEDPLIIKEIPDIFVSGHIHQTTVSSYRNVSMINSSCWVVQSEDNAKRGIIPNPCRIPIINLKTREVRIMNFLDEDTKVLLSERAGLK